MQEEGLMRIRKLLLISPPAFTFRAPRDVNPLPPMGLGYLASVAEGLGTEVRILDCLVRGWSHEEEVNDQLVRVGLSERDIEDQIRDFNPDMIGINCQFSRQYKIYHSLFALVKRVRPDIITIAGGPHTTVCPEEVLGDPNCDFIVSGEAEEAFRDLIIALNSGKGTESIDGLGWKFQGQLHVNPKQKVIADLDSIDFPAYHLMDLDRYFGLSESHGPRHKKRFAPIITSRGCPAQCAFCSAHKVWGRRYRVRSVDNVLNEMRLLKDVYGIEEIMFEDDNVTANPKRAKELFRRMVEEKFNFVWDTPNGVGVWSMDTEMIDLMKESGCVNLNFPVESGSQEVLSDIIKKPLKLAKVKELMAYCKKIGLSTGMFLVVGMPGEKIGDMWKSFRFAADCGCYSPHISVATPYPGSELFDECVKNGYFTRSFSLDDLFIKSFTIKTADWDEDVLRKTILKGYLFLRFSQVVKEPLQFLKWAFMKARRPSSFIGHIKRILGKKRKREKS
jgi:anaerobic magnesium-protoporphyrin IX monomethyl ester cyclase